MENENGDATYPWRDLVDREQKANETEGEDADGINFSPLGPGEWIT